MKYNCKNCKFHWEGNIDTFDKVLTHEKTHPNPFPNDKSSEIMEIEKEN